MITRPRSSTTVTQSGVRHLAGTEPARGRQPTLGVGFDELLKKWVVLQRLYFKLPVTKPRLLHHVKAILRGTDAVNTKGVPYEEAIDLACVDRLLRRSHQHGPRLHLQPPPGRQPCTMVRGTAAEKKRAAKAALLAKYGDSRKVLKGLGGLEEGTLLAATGQATIKTVGQVTVKVAPSVLHALGIDGFDTTSRATVIADLAKALKQHALPDAPAPAPAPAPGPAPAPAPALVKRAAPTQLGNPAKMAKTDVIAPAAPPAHMAGGPADPAGHHHATRHRGRTKGF